MRLAACREENPDLREGLVMDLWMLGVPPEFQRRGVSQTLVKLSTELARRKGYKHAVAEVTGHFSARAFEKCGFSTRTVREYASVEFEVDSERCSEETHENDNAVTESQEQPGQLEGSQIAEKKKKPLKRKLLEGIPEPHSRMAFVSMAL
uniref:N-acetyltransferase domain-containing protein n=1 Tax=Chromera velia CCMP2878 TaxID=1169474 RepID=A0A0G4GM23_9ALVE|eukprot:Cvel_22494.t1-p1 / transcript=Cvel_22494.t1 / gene=Cvel_22494 / organism=Chromera_velia_CCMP2878 / gene_product=hypothetical protein / transcript_product=hypothetical protein / location=Cvel_scaffold2216:30918-31364(+) / protein_length=149 / sequence_SO=supercontig / SO=protein_coding / is_pseudo=false